MTDRFDLFGGRGAEEDKFGLWGGAAPGAKPKKRTRSKRVPQARDVEAPVSPEADATDKPGQSANQDEDKYGLRPKPELTRGAPPTAAGKPERELRTPVQRAWYEELADSATSALQGAALNTLDEATAAGYWATDKLGLTDSHASFEENHDIYKKGLDRVTRDYPVGHGAGQAATGMAVGAALPAGAIVQGLGQAALSGASEYADSRDLSDTAWATGAGGAMGAGGAKLGSMAAKLFARSPKAAVDAELQAIARASRARPGSGPRLSTPEPAPVVPESGPPKPLDSPVPPRPYEPTYGAPDVPEPRPLPVEASPGGYDPLAGQQFATPAGPPRPQPVDMRGAGIPEARISPVTKGPGGRFQRRAEYPGELDMSPAPGLPAPPTEAPYGPSGARDWTFEFPASEAAMRGPAPRTGGMPRDPALEYALGEVPAPEGALPRPRVGGPVVEPEAPASYALGDVPLEPGIRAPAIPEASERELQRIALQRAQNEMQPSAASRGLKGASTLMALGGHPLPAAGLRAASMLASPTVREGALKSGYLVPNPAAAMRTRMGVEAGYELGLPAAFESKVNAQDAEPVAYADGPTFNYAISETLHGGRTGLKPEDEQALTEAVVRGDDDAIRATSFRLRQKNPAYARQVERALRSYNEGDDR